MKKLCDNTYELITLYIKQDFTKLISCHKSDNAGEVLGNVYHHLLDFNIIDGETNEVYRIEVSFRFNIESRVDFEDTDDISDITKILLLSKDMYALDGTINTAVVIHDAGDYFYKCSENLRKQLRLYMVSDDTLCFTYSELLIITEHRYLQFVTAICDYYNIVYNDLRRMFNR